MNLNRLLKRQVKKFFGNIDTVPKEFIPFIDTINQSYQHYESDRKLLEHTMEINSVELTQTNELLKKVAAKQKKLLENLKNLVIQLRSENDIADGGEIQYLEIENIGEILENEIQLKNENEHELKKIKTAIDQSASSIIITNSKNEIEFVNPSFEQITGYSLEEVKGKNPSILKGECNEENKFSKLWTDLREKGTWRGEFCNQKKNGTIFWESANISVIKDKNNNPVNYIAVKEDITDQKKLEEILRKKEKEYRQILDSANDVIYRTDKNGCFTYVNPLTEKLTGYSTKELLKMHFTDLIAEESKASIQQFYGECFKSIDPIPYKEFRIVTKSGQELWVGQNIKSFRDENNHITEFTGVVRDVSKIKEIQKELIEAKNSAEESSRGKEMFLANMSHEIRTPMNAILGMTNLLSESDLNDKQQKYIDAILTSADNLLVIINDILDISKIESGKLELEKIDFDFRELVNNTKKTIELKAEEKGLLFELIIESSIPRVVQSDPVRINQILLNLLSNAVKFTDKGSVKLICSLVIEHNKRAAIKFEVVDSGIGIKSDKIDKIFESFGQEDATTTRKFGGTGLGLSISKQLVSMLGGDLQVKDNMGHGTCFYFTLTLGVGKVAVKRKRVKANIETNPLRNKNILLVEDNQINRFLATTILEGWNVNVDTAENGQIAVDKIREMHYDLVLMDIQMPIMGGFEATELIRSELQSEVPIIALTANAVKGDNETCINAGMNDYVSKPFDPSILFNKMINHISINS